MTQFHPGQRVRVYGQDAEIVRAACRSGFVYVKFLTGPDAGYTEKLLPGALEPIPEPGIPAHLRPTPETPECRHWPVWRK